jgi:carboxymethylenebutenolidase
MSPLSRRHFLGQGAAGAAAIALGAKALGAQDWAKAILDRSPRKKEWVTVKHHDRTVDAFVAHPQSTEKAPGIVVIHEIFGMTDWVQTVTDEFAAAGWVAIAPDLLTGMTPDGKPARNLPMSAAGGMITKLPPEQVTADLNACVDYVKGLPSCNGKVSVVGFSWGGSQCFRFATNRSGLASAFVFYGSGPDAADIPRIQAPVYGFYGGNDARIAATLPATQQQMKEANKVFDAVTYEGAAHGFMRSGDDPSGPEADKKAREAAWVRLKSLGGNKK